MSQDRISNLKLRLIIPNTEIIQVIRSKNEEPDLLHVMKFLSAENIPGLPPGGGITSKWAEQGFLYCAICMNSLRMTLEFIYCLLFFLLHRRDCIISAYQKYSAAFRPVEPVVSPVLTNPAFPCILKVLCAKKKNQEKPKFNPYSHFISENTVDNGLYYCMIILARQREQINQGHRDHQDHTTFKEK